MEVDSQTGIWRGADRHQIYDETLAQALVEFCREREFDSVVDLGCGAGHYVRHLRTAGVNCSGFDGNPATPEITGNDCGVLRSLQTD